MSEQHSTEGDATPTWYVEYFLPFGYAREGLEQAWAGLSDSARSQYRALLADDIIPPERSRP